MNRLALVVSFILLFNANFPSSAGFFERFSFKKGYQAGYDKGHTDGWNFCKSCYPSAFSNFISKYPTMSLMSIHMGVFASIYLYVRLSNYFIDTPQQVLAANELVRNELRELKLVLDGQKIWDSSFLSEYRSCAHWNQMPHLQNKFIRLNNRLDLSLTQVLDTLKSIVLQLPHTTAKNITILRHELYHQVNDLYRELSHELPDNVLGHQIKDQLKLDTDIATFLLS